MTKPLYDFPGKKVWVCGHTGMVGSALVRKLKAMSDVKVLTVDRKTLDLTRQAAVEAWVEDHKPEVIFLAAAKVGGIQANATYPAEFIYENMMIATHIIHAAYKTHVEKLLFLGSSCIYPKYAEQPIKEEALLSGSLEPTNEAYAIAKIAGIKMAQAYRRQYGCDFISAMPTNLYGPGDNFHPENSHVIPALLQRVHLAKENNDPAITLWGSGTVRREFMHVDDCAAALIFLMTHYSGHELINIGQGEDVTIRSLLETVMDVIGYKGEIISDCSKPDGPPRKFMDTQRLRALGWSPAYNLQEGLAETYKWYLENEDRLRKK